MSVVLSQRDYSRGGEQKRQRDADGCEKVAHHFDGRISSSCDTQGMACGTVVMIGRRGRGVRTRVAH